MARLRHLIVGLIALTGAVSTATAQDNLLDCGPVEGDWSWTIGGVVTVAPGGTAGWSPNADGAPALTATWSCDQTSGAVTIRWQQGVIDTLVLSDDGQRLEGTNQFGITVAGSRAATVAPADQGPVDPRLVGTWVLEVWLPTAKGPVEVIWEIAADGNYVVVAGDLSHAGALTARAATWQLSARTSTFTDGGRYELPDWATLVTYAQAGVGRWHRQDRKLRLETIDVGGQLLPTDLGGNIAAARPHAAQWQADARLVAVEHRRSDQPQPIGIELRFFSPATGRGLWVTTTTAGTQFKTTQVAHWRERQIPDGFLDLPQAWAIARQYGLQPPLDRATLEVAVPEGADAVLAWTIAAARGDDRVVSLDAIGGHDLGDLNRRSVDAYNAQWEAAVAGLRRLLAPPRPMAVDSSGWSSDGPSSSSSSTDSSNSDANATPGAQGAWGANDMEAYDRIIGGTPTGDDCYRYGC